METIMGHRRQLAVSIAAALILAATGAAHAQSADAEAMFAEGDQLMKAGKLREACEAFEASNRLETRAGTLIRLGECREANDELASAWSAYKDALTRAKDPRKRALASAKVAALEPALSYLTVSVADESRVDGLVLTRNDQQLDPALWNRALPVNGGDYMIAGRAPGHEAWMTPVHVAARGAKVSVEVPKFKELDKLLIKPTPPAPAAVARDDLAAPRAVPPRRSAWTGKREAAIGVAAGGAIALAVGVVLGAQATARERDANALCPAPGACADAASANALIQASRDRAVAADVSLAAGGVAVITGAVLWLTGAPEQPPHPLALAPRWSASGAGLVVSGRF
jgi:tetratricopeptide (TPR) repeat protein